MRLPRQDSGLIERAYALFDEFYTALTPFRNKCAANEEFWKANHWHDVAKKEADEPRPVTPVLFSTLESLLADIMDNYPEAHIFADHTGDDRLAKALSKAIKNILKKRNYRKTYREKVRSALKKGVSVQEVFWDADLCGGLGDINVRAWDIKNFLFDPATENIQDGRAVFKFGFFHEEWFARHFPSALNKMKSDGYAKEYFSDLPNTDDDTHMVIEYWYKTADSDGKQRVHMAKLAGGVLLEKSEQVKPEGMYIHGQYPFIVEPLYRLEGLPIGLGIIDILKNLQQYADKLDQIILKNTLMSGKLKMLVNKNADVDEEAMLDWSKEVVTAARIDDGAVRWFQAAPLNPYVMAHMNSKLASIKEESGQNQFVRGEAANGVTAASAILALQSAGSKRSRMIIDQMYDGFSDLIGMMVSLISENYTEARVLRLDNGGQTSNIAFSADMMHYAYDEEDRPVLRDGKKIPRYFEYDVTIEVEKQTPYQTLYLNELALNLMKSGMIDHSEALSMMNFDGKEKIAAMVSSRKANQSQGGSTAKKTT
ncbi:MAG: hypothetical protein AB1Z19_02320 [Eubacteriales bacterium]